MLFRSLAWNVDDPDQEEFDRIWSTHTFKDGQDVLAAWKDLGETILDKLTWDYLYHSWDSDIYTKDRWGQTADREFAEELQKRGEKMAREIENPQLGGEVWIREELHHAAEDLALLGEKIELIFDLKENEGATNPELAKRLRQWADKAERLYTEYEKLWRRNSKESDLADIREKMTALIEEARDKAEALDE